MSSKNLHTNQLKDSISSRSLSHNTISQKLSRAIEKEYQKKIPDLEFVMACEELLWEISTDGTQSFPDANPIYQATIDQHIAKPMRLKQPSKFSIVFCCLLIVVLLGEVFVFQWFTGNSTPNSQQYIVSGHVIDNSAIQASTAASLVNQEPFITDDWQDVIEHLGFEPSAPSQESLNATSVTYTIYHKLFSVALYAHYNCTTESILYSIDYHTALNDISISIEQSSQGYTEIINGKEVYISSNHGYYFYVWWNGMSFHHLNGFRDVETGKALVSQLINGGAS